MKTVLAAIRNQSVLWMIGRRRMGKSSLLAAAAEHVDNDVHPGQGSQLFAPA
jgi:hypothetical protein